MMTVMVNGVERTEQDLCVDIVRPTFARHGASDLLSMIPPDTIAYFVSKERKTPDEVYAACCRTHAES